MVQLSPDTRGEGVAPRPGGYEWDDDQIRGFSHTHLSGAGCNSLGHVPFMPTVGSVSSDPAAYASAFDHAREQTSPGSYAVDLGSYGIRAELSATARTGWHRYTFPASSATNVLIDVGQSLNRVLDAEIVMVDDRTVEGFVASEAFCSGGGPVTVYFSAQFDRPFSSRGTWTDAGLVPQSSRARDRGAGGWVRFNSSTDRTVVAKVGISFVSVAGARANLTAETSGFDFDAVRAGARALWDEQLSRIDVSGGATQDFRKFYSALYRASLHPNVFSDADGRFRGFDGAVHDARGYTRYANFSLWDTYRNQHQLLSLVAPERARDMVTSLVDGAAEAGWVPRWTLANVETNIQSGDPVSPFLVDAYRKGLLDARLASRAYAALWRNATTRAPPSVTPVGRVGVESYVSRGFAPFARSPHHARSGASATLEYALADCALAGMARDLGHPDDASVLEARAGSYAVLFDRQTGTFRPRLADASFMDPFDPEFIGLPYVDELSAGYDEGSARQYLWLVPQDVPGLTALLGGREATARKLDEFFALDQVLAAPQHAGTLWQGGGRYSQSNELDLHAPYLYPYLGQAWKTQALVNAALDYAYGTNADGLPGNDDLGSLSSWYVLSALGLYPIMPGSDFYVLTSPRFKRAVVRLSRPAYAGDPLVIEAPEASPTHRYVQSLTVDGSAHERAWLSHDAVRRGATLVYRLGPEPNRAFAGGPGSAPPTSCPRAPASFTISPSSAREGQPVTFDASGSGAPVGAVRYEWDLDGDGSFEVTTAGPTLTRSFAQAGAHSITLRVVDARGERSATSGLTVGEEGGGDSPAPGPGDSPAPDPSDSPAPVPSSRDRTRQELRPNMLAAETALRRSGTKGLLKVRGVSFTASAVVAGKLRVTLEVRLRDRRRSNRGRVVVARGSTEFRRAGSKVVQVKLTRQGRRTLHGSRRLKVALRMSFVDAGSGRTAAARMITLGRPPRR